MFNEFKNFIARGNVLELAVGFLMGTYFGAIVKSLANDIIMPPLGAFLGGMDFSDMRIILRQGITEGTAADGSSVAAIEEVAIHYGMFFNTILTFLIISFAVFLLVQVYNRFRRKEEAKSDSSTPPPPSKDIELLIEIRDLLKERRS